jgi:uncharacterized protein
MRTITFIIFYSIVLSIYLLINYYMFIRGWQSLPAGSRIRSIYLGVFIFLSLSYIAGRVLERFWLGQPTSFLLWAGSFWLGAMIYIILILILIDFVRLLNLAVPVIPNGWMSNPGNTKMILFIGTITVVSVITIAAHVNTWFPKTTTLELELDGKNSHMRSLRIVMVSDIHLGSLTPKNRIEKMVRKINSLDPEIILTAGDVLDEDVGPVIYRDLGSALKQLEAPLGVYGVTGNHEYIGGVREAANYLTSHGIFLIRDSVIKINNSFYLAGREDRSIDTFSEKKRKSVEELLSFATDDLPVILLDHQPYSLEKSAAAGADLQLSGHTHHGQLWPFNFITRAIYTISRGYGEIDGMKVYVSNGIGTWGPPMRLGSRPEIVVINVTFNNL